MERGTKVILKENCNIELDNGKTVEITTEDVLIFLDMHSEGIYCFCIKKLHGTGRSAILLARDEFELEKRKWWEVSPGRRPDPINGVILIREQLKVLDSIVQSLKKA